MQLFEMQGLLAGKCLPGDMLVGESLAKYLLRQLNQRDEIARQVSALQTSQDNIINGLGIEGEGPLSKLVIEYVLELVAENAALKERNRSNLQFIAEELGDPEFRAEAVQAPNTDAFTTELRAQGVDEFAESVADMHSKTETGSRLEVQLSFTGDAAVSFAANLRAGRKG